MTHQVIGIGIRAIGADYLCAAFTLATDAHNFVERELVGETHEFVLCDGSTVPGNVAWNDFIAYVAKSWEA